MRRLHAAAGITDRAPGRRSTAPKKSESMLLGMVVARRYDGASARERRREHGHELRLATPPPVSARSPGRRLPADGLDDGRSRRARARARPEGAAAAPRPPRASATRAAADGRQPIVAATRCPDRERRRDRADERSAVEQEALPGVAAAPGERDRDPRARAGLRRRTGAAPGTWWRAAEAAVGGPVPGADRSRGSGAGADHDLPPRDPVDPGDRVVALRDAPGWTNQ